MDPYRLFFPLGALYAVIGALLWILAAAGWIGYPGVLHQMLMIQGFEQCFVAGFLLTALPGFTHSFRATAAEVGTTLSAIILFGACALAGWIAAAHVFYLLAIGTLVLVGVRRLRRATQPPAEEFVFVALGMAFAAAGALLLVLQGTGAGLALPARFAERLLSLGTVLSLVLGVGALIVPVFIGMRDPLAIPGLAGAHERKPRRPLYAALALLLVASFALDLVAPGRGGPLCRALAATAIMFMVWKLYRLPGRRDLPAFAMWASGWLVLLGLWFAFVMPGLTIASLHVVFIGGFGLLTLAIGTRVVIAHGKHGLPAERKVFTPALAIAVAVALITRAGADLLPSGAAHAHALSAAAWIIGWIIWAVKAVPKITHVADDLLIVPEARHSID